MITIVDLIWVVVYFVLILILLALIRPIFILKRDPFTGQPTSEISGGKLLGWTLLFTVIITLVFFLIKSASHKDQIYI